MQILFFGHGYGRVVVSSRFHPTQQILRPQLHLAEGEPLLPQVLDGGSDVVDLVIDYKETIVRVGELPDGDGTVLCVVTLHVEAERGGHALGVDGGLHSLPTLVQHLQHGIIHIIVYQHNTTLRTTYQVIDELVGVEDLSVVEDALHGRQGGADKEVYFVLRLGHAVLKAFDTLIHSMSVKEVFL